LQEGARDSDFQLLQQTPELCQFPDFLETANLLDSLDLVISVDTAVAHLALSQGIDTWVLLPYAADWRWLEPDVEENPWYPAARTFRPRSAGATLTEMWTSVLLDVRDSLRTWLSHTV
jgi:ADP-heptose:LPS heptosyltransferase